MIEAIIISLCAMTNRFAGGGVWVGEWWNPSDPNKLWGRALYPAIALIGLVALIAHPWQEAVVIALTFALWRAFSWGALIGLGRPSGADDRDHNPVEATLLAWLGPHGGLFARHLFVAPGFLVLAIGNDAMWIFWIGAPAFAALATLAYEIAWRSGLPGPIRKAEILVGALWGAVIVIV